MTTVRRSPGGGESRNSQEIETAVLTIGRGTDQHIHVPDLQVALSHAHLIAFGPGKFQLDVVSRNGVLVNGRRQQGGVVRTQYWIELGGTRITIEAAPAGFDMALEVRRVAAAARGDERERARTARRGSAVLRLASWLAFLAILGVGLVHPLISHYAPEKRKLMAALSLPGTGIWLPGPMAAPHEYFGDECTTCHQEPFHPVPDQVCKDCHSDVALHVPGHPNDVPDPAAQGCESCHLEHSGADELIMTSQAFCADCHRDTSRFTGLEARTAAATDFSREHPPFRVTLARLDSGGGLEQFRAPLSKAGTSEHSNLLFPHDAHLDPDGVESPEGKIVMRCEDCHAEEPGGALMAAINFEAHCSSCHRLDFDLSAPDREVPHGDPQAALDVLVDFYAQLALRGGSEEVAIPALESAATERALQWARRQALQAAGSLFEDRACMQCHAVEREASGDLIAWEIPPVYQHSFWLPAARFDHRSHEVAECKDCHGAAGSSASDDVLLPDIGTCRECHGGEGAAQGIASTCVSCHRFHNPERPAADFSRQYHRGTLSLMALPDLEAGAREIRGMDPRRKRPGEQR